LANTFIWTNGAAAALTVYTGDGTDTTHFVRDGSEFGAEDTGELVGEMTPDRLSDRYRGVVYRPRDYGYTVLITRDTAANLESSIAAWRVAHNRELGQGHIKRVTFGGVTKELDCVPLSTVIVSKGPTAAEVTQTYRAFCPWWRSESLVTDTDDLAGAVPVNFSCANAGQIATWPQIVITGVYATSVTFTNTAGDTMTTLAVNANADDTMTFDCRPTGTYARTCYYLLHGAGSPVYKPISSGSKYVTLPTGTNNLAGVLGGAGTPSVTISWYNYYGGLY